MKDLDRLRILGLSRIPRCSVCPRLRAFRNAVASGPLSVDLVPPAPRGCQHQVCRPLIPRYFRAGLAPPRTQRAAGAAVR
jgi:hypothetical protein